RLDGVHESSAFASSPPSLANRADNLRLFSRSAPATSPYPMAVWGRDSLLARYDGASKRLRSYIDRRRDRPVKSALALQGAAEGARTWQTEGRHRRRAAPTL